MSTTRRNSADSFGSDAFSHLEPRIVLSTVYWDAGGDGMSWEDPSNWSVGSLTGGADAVPTDTDDVILNASGDHVIKFTAAAGTQTVNSIDNRETLSVEGGSLTVTNSFLSTSGATLRYSGGSLAGSPVIRDGTLDLQGGLEPLLFTMQGSSTLAGSVKSGQELWVHGTGAGGIATLSTAAGTTNAGTIRLESTLGAWNSTINTGGGDLTSTGVIRSLAGSGGVRTISGNLANAGQLITESGTLTVSGSYTAAGGSIEGEGQTRIINATIATTAAAPTLGKTIIVGAQGVSIVSSNLQGYEIWMRGGGDHGHGQLTINPASIDNGVIRLESEHSTWTSNLTTLTGDVIFGPSLTLNINPGTGGNRWISTNIINRGTINVGADAVARIPGNASRTFIQESGAINADGSFYLDEGTFTLRGGTLSGTVAANNASASVEATAPPATLQLWGNSHLLSNLSSSVELWVRGQSGFGHAVMTSAPGAVNAGTIRFESTHSNWHSRLDTADSLTNTGVIRSVVGTGGTRELKGTIVNAGQIINEGGPLVIAGAYDAAGGSISGAGDTRIVNTILTISANAPALNKTIIVAGQSVTLASSNLRGYEIWMRGAADYGHGSLTVSAASLNTGVIRLESANSNWRSNLTSTSGLLTFGSSLTLDVNTGTGGDRWIQTSLVNHGVIDVDAATEAIVKGDGSHTFTQVAGSINAQGRFYLDGGTFLMQGGTLTGEVGLFNATISVADSAVMPGTIQLWGASHLITNSSSSVELWVRGRALFGIADLSLAGGAANFGTIRLESTDSTWRSRIVMGGGDLINVGVIRSVLASGGNRSIHGTLINAGQVITEDGELIITGAYDAAGGSITGAGLTRVDDAVLTMSLPAPGTGNVIIVSLASVILDSADLQGYELWVRGSANYGNTTLNLAQTTANNGVIRLESLDSTYQSNLASIPGDMTFGTSLVLDVVRGTGGGRTLFGNSYTNTGRINIQDGIALSIPGDFAQGSTGTLHADVASETSFGTLDINGTATLDGTFSAVYVESFVPPEFTRFRFLIADGGVTGEFSNFTEPSAPPTDKTVLVYNAGDVEMLATDKADFDYSTPDVLNLFDILTYLNLFNSGDPVADIDGNPGFTLFDILTFLNQFNDG